MRGGDNSRHNLVSNVVTMNLNVLHTLIKSRIANDEDNDLIITIHGLGEGEEIMRFSRNDQSYTISCAFSVIAR